MKSREKGNAKVEPEDAGPGHSKDNDEERLFKLLSPSKWRSIWSARMAEDLSKIYGAAMLGSTCEFLSPFRSKQAVCLKHLAHLSFTQQHVARQRQPSSR